MDTYQRPGIVNTIKSRNAQNWRLCFSNALQ